jgi:PAS domain S-box-containing protein
MTTPIATATRTRGARVVGRLAGGVAVVVGVSVLIGWFLDIDALRTVMLSTGAMKVNTAACLVALGTCSYLDPSSARELRVALAALATTTALLTLVEYAVDVDLRIDELVHADTEGEPGEPGRMPAPTVLAIASIGGSILLSPARSRRRAGLGQALAVVGLAIAVLSLAGRLYGVPALYGSGVDLTGMALPTAIVAFALAFACVVLRPDLGVVRPLADPGLTGRLGRRLLLVAMLLPLALGWLRLEAQRAGWVGLEAGLAAFTMSTVVAFSAMAWFITRALLRAEGDRQAAADALAESQLQTQLFVDRAPAAIHGKDLEGRYVLANAMFAALRSDGRSVVGHTDDEIAHPDVAKARRTADQRVLDTRQAIELEASEPGADGSERLFSMVKFPLVDGTGDIYGVGGIATDITDRRRLEREHDALTDRIYKTERLDSLGQLAGGVAHDFRNLLGVILNFTTFIEQDTTDEQTLEDAQAVREAAERGVALTSKLLAFSGQAPTLSTAIDVNVTIASLLDLLERTMPSNLQWARSLDPQLWPVVTDASQLEQLVLNLVVNARDAMPDGGTVSVETANLLVDADHPRRSCHSIPGPTSAWPSPTRGPA